MKHLIIAIPFSVTVVLLVLLWCGWEAVYPVWGRVALSLAAIALTGLTIRFRKESQKLPVEANILAGSFLILCTYLLIPFNGLSVLDQFINSRRHLADPVLPLGNVIEFSTWIADGEEIHKRSPWSQERFRSSANERLTESLEMIRVSMKYSAEEIRLYEQWSQLIPDLQSRLPPDNPNVQRMRKLLADAELCQEVYSKFRLSILNENWKSAMECVEQLQKAFPDTGSKEHLSLLIRRMVAMAEYFEITPDSTMMPL